jgi:1-acyl-sn-glycerol-3-phosphate acyltransferase
MTVWGAFGVAAAVMFLPWALMPGRPNDEVRGFLRLLWWVNALYCEFWHRLEVRGVAPLPDKGPAILICNHTCCIDHVILQATTRRMLGFMIARELYHHWFYHPFVALTGCIPVRRDGRDLSATRAALRALEEGRVLPVFPEGRISPTSGRELGEGKPGVAFLALRAGVPVIPAYIWGTPKTNKVVRSFLTPSKARVTFGPPIDLSVFDREGRAGRDEVDGVTRRLMEAIRSLRDDALGLAGPPVAEAADRHVSSGSWAHDADRPDGDPRALPRERAAS